MTKKEKEFLTKEINKIVNPMGGIFRFRTTRDPNWDGVFYPTKKRIVIKWTAGVGTLAHEIAHLVQYNEAGKTSCTRYPLSGEHWLIEKEWEKELGKFDVGKVYTKLLE